MQGFDPVRQQQLAQGRSACARALQVTHLDLHAQPVVDDEVVADLIVTIPLGPARQPDGQW